MGNIILIHLKKEKNVLDLFSGIGTFTLCVAKKMNVHAVENDEVALGNLNSAARFLTGLKTVTCEKRDLFRHPLSVKGLECFESTVFDPPRAGAEKQVYELAEGNSITCRGNFMLILRQLRVIYLCLLQGDIP